MEIKLIASTGRARGQAVEVRAAKFFIGRHDNCQLRPDLEDLAGIHALIEQRDDRLYLRDFGTDSGTGLNDRVLHLRETEIFDGDLIQIGSLVLILSIKAKGEDHHATLREVPEGWPFLTETEAEPHSHRIDPVKAPAEGAAPVVSKVNSFLAREKEPTAVGATVLGHHPAAVAAESFPPPPVVYRPPNAKLFVPRARPHRAISCHQVDNVMVVTLLSPDLNEEETVSPVRYELRTLLDEEEIPNRTVLDLGHTKYLSSRAVGVLLAHYQALERQGASMRVCGVSKEIKPVIDQMRLSRLVDIYPTVEEAIQDPWE